MIEDRERRKLKRTLMIAAGMTTDGKGEFRNACAGRLLVPEVECSSPFRDRARLELHEVVKRSRWRKGLLVRSNCVLLCQAHHDWTEAEVAEATKRGLLSSAPRVDPFDKFDPRERP